ncbi:unnamed protein product [Prorocentrum cordatum]|uniref:Exostosin GT47 domain-containing protein n=1 Tax=Prorocentrum cordatum TaxID=2364126 RepID=A0ABN9TUV2_9DINO|nr:unnamed protein product [Polarella glacialis]
MQAPGQPAPGPTTGAGQQHDRRYAPLVLSGLPEGPALGAAAPGRGAPPWRRRLLGAGCAATAAAAALATLRAAGPRAGGVPPQAVSLVSESKHSTHSAPLPFPAGDYQAAMDYLPITTFYDLTEDRPYLPAPIIHRLPAFLRRFDLRFGLEENLQGWDPEPDPTGDVRSVLCCGTAVNRLLKWAQEHLDDSDNNRTLVFSGTESPLSETWGDEEHRQALVKDFQKYFRRIYYYVTDVPLVGVHTLPLGFTEMYMRERTDQFLEAYQAVSIADSWKEHTILAAWGIYTTAGGEHYEYGNHPFADNYGTDSWAWTEVANHAIDSRNDAIGWISTPGAEATGVERQTIEKDRWWMELSKYKFILSPLGTGIQCSKVPEALSMLTIPIIKRGPFRTHDDLLQMGFPIVVVDYWKDIKHDTMETWWQEMSPKLESFRTNCLNTEGYWRLLTQGAC